MRAKLIDGKTLAQSIKTELQVKVLEKVANGASNPGLAVILVGEDPASVVYVRNKRQASEQVGIRSFYHHLPADITQEALVDLIQNLNIDHNVHGILVQLPLPPHIDEDSVLESIDPYKDVDGFHAYNLGRLAQKRPLLRPCTPLGVMVLLHHIHQVFKGMHAVVIGASNIVGRPMALELLSAGATVTICHRFTEDLPSFVKQADILVSAVGNPGFIKGEWIKIGATVIDIGITRLNDGTLTGDIEFKKAAERAEWITPVPGGVGPMTVAMLMRNTLIAAGFIQN